MDFAGVGFALTAGALWGLYNVLTQHVGDRFSGISGLSLSIPAAALAILPFGLPQVIRASSPESVYGNPILSLEHQPELEQL